jgi:hypothetical protein
LPDTRLEVAGKFLRLAFDNVKYPLGRLVTAAFADVYSVAVQDSKPPSFLAALFGSYDWDKAKDLRVTLIECFLRSSWQPGDLAIAAHRAGILRKIFKRLHRRPSGDRYLRAMFEDLKARRDHSLDGVRESLGELLARPDFYEEWD